MGRKDFRWSRDGLFAGDVLKPLVWAQCWGGSPPSRAPVSRPDQKNGSYLAEILGGDARRTYFSDTLLRHARRKFVVAAARQTAIMPRKACRWASEFRWRT